MTLLVHGIGLLALLLAGQTAAPARDTSSDVSSTHPAYGHRIAAEGVPELIEITPTLYRGGQPTDKGLQTLKSMGFAIIVDGRELHWTERRKVTRLGMRYVPLHWFCLFPSDKIMAKFLAIIRENPHKKIFIHCRLGDDRVGMMIAAFRMADQHWTTEQAMKEMEANGFTPRHHLICPRLAGYERNFPERYKTDPVFRANRSAAAQ